MSAYATPKQDSLRQEALRAVLDVPAPRETAGVLPKLPVSDGEQLLDVLIGQLADRVAAAVAERLGTTHAGEAPEWLDSREAAAYLGLHRDTLRKLAAERAIPAEQDGPGCKLFFRRSALDEWRAAGGRAAQLAAVAA
jgi:excisionase family DNA binding protein